MLSVHHASFLQAAAENPHWIAPAYKEYVVLSVCICACVYVCCLDVIKWNGAVQCAGIGDWFQLRYHMYVLPFQMYRCMS